MTTRSQPQLASSAAPTVPSPRLYRAGTAVAAALIAAIGWTIAVPVAGLHLDVVSFGQPQSVSLASAIIGGLVPGLTGWALLALLERFTRSARRTWTIIASVMLVLSLASPLMATASLATTITLICLHLAVGAALIIGLGRSGTSR